MKCIPNNRFRSFLLTAFLSASASALFAQNGQVTLSSYDDDASIAGVWDWWGGVQKEIVFDPSEDVDGNADSGAMKITLQFDESTGDNQYAIGLSLAGEAAYNGAISVTGEDAGSIQFDLRIDPESTISVEDFNATGDPGFFSGVTTTEWGQTWLEGVPLEDTTEWQTVDIPVPMDTAAFPGIVFKKWVPADGTGLNGTFAFWIDNLRLIEAVEPEPPAPSINNDFSHEFAADTASVWWGGAAQEITLDTSKDNDVGGEGAPGALNIRVEYDNTLADNQYAIRLNFDDGIVGSPVDYETLEFDLLWDSESTISVDAFNANPGDGGFNMGLVTVGDGQAWLGNVADFVDDEEWHHVSVPIDPAQTPDDFVGLIFKKWSPSNADGLTGTASFWIDNIRFVERQEELGAPEVAVRKANAKGLELISATAGAQYQRQNIRSLLAEDLTWVNNPEPVTYAFTIAAFPGSDFQGYQAHLFLVPDFSTGDVDWIDPNVIMFDIQLQEDGVVLGSFRHKVNQANGNSMLYSDGSLGGVTSTTAVGTWSITFSNDTEIQLTSPDGTVADLVFPESSVPFFDSSFMGVYLGSQNNQIAYIGQSVTYSNMTVSVGDNVIVDDNFDEMDEFEVLNPDNWERIATLDATHMIVADNAVWVTWTLPDVGWSPASSTDLVDWQAIDGQPAGIGGTRSLLLQGDAVPEGNAGYFRMETSN